MFVIDTNVLFASVCSKDPTHKSAVHFFSENTKSLHAPEILKIELMALLVRKFDISIAESYFKTLISVVVFHENASMDVLLEYVKHKKTRGCDSFFAYLSDKMSYQIVSFDVDLVRKTDGVLLTPQ